MTKAAPPSAARPAAPENGPRPRRVRPYPLDTLPRLLRVQGELSRILWGHIAAVLATARIHTTASKQALERTLGGHLQVQALEPYLGTSERLSQTLRGARVLELVRTAPGSPRFLLAVDRQLCLQLGLGTDERMADLQDWVGQALRGTALQVAPILPDATAALLTDPTLRDPLMLDATVRVGDFTGWARLITASALRVSAMPPRPLPQAPALGRLAGVQSQLVIEAGYGFLRSREVLALAVGDIVVPDHFGPRPVTGGPVWLRLGGGVFPGHLDGSGVTVLGSYYLRAQAMVDPHSEESSSPTAGSSTAATAGTDGGAPTEALLRELPVQITCEIGRVTLSAREVLDLRPGAVLPVGRPLAGPVDLTAGGRVLARGELVDVEGEIGVRVTEIVE